LAENQHVHRAEISLYGEGFTSENGADWTIQIIYPVDQ